MITRHQTLTDEVIEIFGKYIDPAEPVWMRIRWLAQRLFEAEALAEAANEVERGRERAAAGPCGTGFVDGIGFGYALAAYREGRGQ